MDKTQVNIRLSDGLINTLKNRAEAEGVSFTYLVSRCIELGLEQATESPISSNEFYELKARVSELESELGKSVA